MGARSDEEVYEEMNARVATLGSNPSTQALASVIELLGRSVQRCDIQASAEPQHDPVPDRLQQRLVHAAKVPAEQVETMTGSAAMERRDRFMHAGD